jgi:CheY-like chemotaxis protein
MKKILVIEDDRLVRDYLVTLLARAGYTALAASNGNEGITLHHRAPADVVITDIIMPEKDGIETIIDLRRAEPVPKVIAISGGGHIGADDYLRSAALLGADLVLNKPFTGEAILDAVDRLLVDPRAADQRPA